MVSVPLTIKSSSTVYVICILRSDHNAGRIAITRTLINTRTLVKTHDLMSLSRCGPLPQTTFRHGTHFNIRWIRGPVFSIQIFVTRSLRMTRSLSPSIRYWNAPAQLAADATEWPLFLSCCRIPFSPRGFPTKTWCCEMVAVWLGLDSKTYGWVSILASS